jgi:hypothetical protein
MLKLLRQDVIQVGRRSHHLLGDLSGAALVGKSIFVVVDEQDIFVRLEFINGMWQARESDFYRVRDFVDLPFPKEDANGNLKQECDLEGISYVPTSRDGNDGWLTLIGSFSLKRKRIKGLSIEEDLQRLATVVAEPNRNVLVTIPIRNGRPVQGASWFKMKKNGSPLLELFANDPVIGASLSSGMVSKENGFDVEGVAVMGDRIFIGLRGPVIDKLAVILEIRVARKDNSLVTEPIGRGRYHFRKHLLPLEGLGVRDLTVDGDDLLILAGTSMAQKGSYSLYRWTDVSRRTGGLQGGVETTLSYGPQHGVHWVGDFPTNGHYDKPEGITLIRPGELLVVFDSPHEARLSGDGGCFADIFAIG